MNGYFTLRFLHSATAIIFIGGIFARQIIRARANQTDDVRVFAALHEAAGRIETRMVIPGNLAVIVVGVLLALLTHAPIFGFLQGASHNWLLASNLLLVFGFLVVMRVFVPRGKKFEVLLQDALAKGQITPELRAEVDDRLIRVLHVVEMSVVVLIVALMVFKPF
jgi:uncharacterized membrane protein